MEDEFVRAASEGRVEELRALLASGVDPNARDVYGSLALGAASRRSHVGCVEVWSGNGDGVMYGSALIAVCRRCWRQRRMRMRWTWE